MKFKKAICVLVLCGMLSNGACTAAHALLTELLILGAGALGGAYLASPKGTDYFDNPDLNSDFKLVAQNDNVKAFINTSSIERFTKTYPKKFFIKKTYNLSSAAVLYVYSQSRKNEKNYPSQRKLVCFIAEPKSKKIFETSSAFIDDKGNVISSTEIKTDFNLDTCDWDNEEPAEKETFHYEIAKNM